MDIPADLARYYAGDYYQFDRDGHPRWKNGGPAKLSAEHRVALLRRYAPSGSLIEIGAGAGAFAVAARDAGYAVVAVEMDRQCCEYLTQHEAIEAVCTDDPLNAMASLPPADVIASWHVLEHLRNPAEMIEALAAKLRPGGILAIAVPNASSLQFRLLKTRWAHLDAPRHVCLVPPKALIRKAEDVGLHPVATTTTDPDGLECNLLGWISALKPPVNGSVSPLLAKAALATSLVMAPIERTGQRGAAITLVMQKSS